jgi:hypothetical protein
MYYNNCPIIWASKLQMSVAVSTCEAEYVALSTALREVIPLMRLLDTIMDVWNIDSPQPHIVVHKDNQSNRQLATNEAYKPRMRHLVVKYHHFCDYVNSGCIRIDYIRTMNKLPISSPRPCLKILSLTSERNCVDGPPDMR